MGLTDSNCRVEIAKDAMAVLLTLVDASALDSISTDSLMAWLTSKGVKYGIDEYELQRLNEPSVIGKPATVARGTAPVDASDEQIIYHFKADSDVKPLEGEDGAVDFRNLDNFNNTQAGTLLAERQQANPGKPGMTVTGIEIPPKPGKVPQFKVGKGAELSADGSKVLASVSGHACLQSERITVQETIDISGDVDFGVGNIRFLGNVRIRGGVHPGFSIEAGGNVEIGGNVEEANVTAGNCLTIRGIVFGHGKSKLYAERDAHVGALDQAVLDSRGDLRVDNYIRHCRLRVGGNLVVTGQRGSIIGGETFAFRGVDAPNIGNNMATLTKLTVGSNPFAGEGLAQQEAVVQGLEAKVTQFNAAITMIQKRRQPGQSSDPEDLAMIAKYTQALSQIREQLTAEQATLDGMRAQQADYREARVKVSTMIHPGVLINFRNRLQYKTNEEGQRISFYEEDAEVRIGPY